MDQKTVGENKGKQKADTVYQGSFNMLNEHRSIPRLDEELCNLMRADNVTRSKKKKIQAMEDAMQGKMSELKKRQEPLRKGLETWQKKRRQTTRRCWVKLTSTRLSWTLQPLKSSSTPLCPKMIQRKAAVVFKVLTKRQTAKVSKSTSLLMMMTMVYLTTLTYTTAATKAKTKASTVQVESAQNFRFNH